MTTELLTPPLETAFEAFYPLAQLKSDLVIVSPKIDNKLKRMLRAAVQLAGQTARCVILPTQYISYFDKPRYSCDPYGINGKWVDSDQTRNGIAIPNGPIISIDEVLDGTTSILPAKYRLSRPDNRRASASLLWLDENGVSTTYTIKSQLAVKYTAGFDELNPNRPSMVHVCFEIIAHWLSTPGEVNDYSALAIPQSALSLLAGFWSSQVNRRII